MKKKIHPPQGDAHNFGRRSHRVSHRAVKHRDLPGEFLFLSPNSPLHLYLNELFLRICPGRKLLPALEIAPPGMIPTLQPQEMEWLNLSPVSGSLERDDFFQVGAMMALIAWSGLSDCHAENMVLGKNSEEELFFTSVDWETVFTKLSHPYEHGLFKVLTGSDAGPVPFKPFGLSHFNSYKVSPENIAEAIWGLLRMAELLKSHQKELLEKLRSSLDLKNMVRRVLLRETEAYLNKTLIEPYIPEEREQLDRGDVPYFFQIGTDPEIYWWKSETTYEKVHSPLPKTFLGPFRLPEFPDEFLEKMLVGIARSLAPSKGVFHGQYEGLKVFLKENSVVILFEDRTYSGSRLVTND